jgi:hypothetical protein
MFQLNSIWPTNPNDPGLQGLLFFLMVFVLAPMLSSIIVFFIWYIPALYRHFKEDFK